MKWTLKARKLWYKLTGDPVWLHTKCVNKKAFPHNINSKPDDHFHKPFWVIGYHCPHCEVNIEDEDYYCNRPAGQYTLHKLDPVNYNMFSRFDIDDR